jgi:hypothetical protein
MAYFSSETLGLLRTALDEAWGLLPDHRKFRRKASAIPSSFARQR